MKKLLWQLCGGNAREKQQRLRHKCISILCMDEIAGWLETYFTPRNLGGKA